MQVPPVRYANRPTATSCLSTRKAVTYHETRATPTQSPTAPHSTVLGDDSGVSQRSGSSRKHVQFPDTNMVTATAIDDEGDGEAGAGAVVVVMEEPWTKGAKTPRLLCPSVDLAPLINPEPPSILLHTVKQIKFHPTHVGIRAYPSQERCVVYGRPLNIQKAVKLNDPCPVHGVASQSPALVRQQASESHQQQTTQFRDVQYPPPLRYSL
uniref:Uncharacterized protein n=1 Tax=Timema tahoe TaxID=61484 RepID=A0A7R9IG47_9NEOP|nr:unnamed protein product [Timema tahoe]